MQEIMEDATFNEKIKAMKADGTLQEFTASEVWKQRRILSKLPCLNDKTCPTPVQPLTRLRAIAPTIGTASATGTVFVLLDLLLRWLLGG